MTKKDPGSTSLTMIYPLKRFELIVERLVQMKASGCKNLEMCGQTFSTAIPLWINYLILIRVIFRMVSGVVSFSICILGLKQGFVAWCGAPFEASQKLGMVGISPSKSWDFTVNPTRIRTILELGRWGICMI